MPGSFISASTPSLTLATGVGGHATSTIGAAGSSSSPTSIISNPGSSSKSGNQVVFEHGHNCRRRYWWHHGTHNHWRPLVLLPMEAKTLIYSICSVQDRSRDVYSAAGVANGPGGLTPTVIGRKVDIRVWDTWVTSEALCAFSFSFLESCSMCTHMCTFFQDPNDPSMYPGYQKVPTTDVQVPAVPYKAGLNGNTVGRNTIGKNTLSGNTLNGNTLGGYHGLPTV
jgi:hypothetical protein